MDPLPNTIDEVIGRLDREIRACVRAGSRLALFACLYRAVTLRVLEGIERGRFEDGPRMERLDVVFANRYFVALDAYRRGSDPGRSWRIAFDAARSSRLLILQHLLLGMNAHINLDLGISAAETSPGGEIDALRDDFFEITVLLGEMLDDVQERIGGISPWLSAIDRIGCRNDEKLFSFVLAKARHEAWSAARRFAALGADDLPRELDRLDCATALVAHPIRYPALSVRPVLLAIRLREPGRVEAVVEALS